MPSRTVPAGYEFDLFAIPKDSEDAVLSGRTATFASSNTAVASVDETTGRVTAVAAGTAVISARVEGREGTFDLTVSVGAPVVSMTRSPATLSMGAGGAAQNVVVRDWDAAAGTGNELIGRTITAVSSATGVATVEASKASPGTFAVTPVGAGSATITFESEGVTTTVAVTVAAAAVATEITLSSAAAISVAEDAGNLTRTATLRDQYGNPFAGTVACVSSNPSALAVAPASGASPQAFTLDPLTPGTGTLTFSSAGVPDEVVSFEVTAVAVFEAQVFLDAAGIGPSRFAGLWRFDDDSFMTAGSGATKVASWAEETGVGPDMIAGPGTVNEPTFDDANDRLTMHASDGTGTTDARLVASGIAYNDTWQNEAALTASDRGFTVAHVAIFPVGSGQIMNPGSDALSSVYLSGGTIKDIAYGLNTGVAGDNALIRCVLWRLRPATTASGFWYREIKVLGQAAWQSFTADTNVPVDTFQMKIRGGTSYAYRTLVLTGWDEDDEDVITPWATGLGVTLVP